MNKRQSTENVNFCVNNKTISIKFRPQEFLYLNDNQFINSKNAYLTLKLITVEQNNFFIYPFQKSRVRFYSTKLYNVQAH